MLATLCPSAKSYVKGTIEGTCQLQLSSDFLPAQVWSGKS
jgi:hypothetical protein